VEDWIAEFEVVVLDEGDGAGRVDAGVVERGHVEEGRPVAHVGQKVEPEREVERGATAAGPPLNPVLDLSDVAVVELADDELAAHRAEVEVVSGEVIRDPLRIVDPVSLDAEGAGHPVSGGLQVVGDVAGGLAVDRGQVGPEAVVGDGDVRVLKDAGGPEVEVLGVLGEPPAAGMAEGVDVAKLEPARALAAAPLVVDNVEVDVDPAGLEDRHAPGQLFPSAATGGLGPLLVLRPEVVVVERVVAEGVDPVRPLRGGGQPDVRDAGLGQGLGLLGQAVPPIVDSRSAGRGRAPFALRELVEGLDEYAALRVGREQRGEDRRQREGEEDAGGSGPGTGDHKMSCVRAKGARMTRRTG
jgi:hypothetical protein